MPTPPVSLRRLVSLLLSAALLGAALLFRGPLEAATQLPPKFFSLIVIVLTSVVVVSIVRILIISSYRSRLNLTPGERDNFVIGVDAVANVLVVLVSIGAIFPALGVPFREFLTSLSLFSVALAWLFKEHLSNFFDSFRLMFSTDFLIGDYIKIN
ncbi:mechanosensitive ion channel, partial [Patescibacteria group bacterium]|nr:mechanosensitive ion channel [Patescibacteria group bacterium]